MAGTAGADASRQDLAWVLESTYGETPAGNPTLQRVRYVSETLKQNTDTVSSPEIESSRQKTGVARVRADAGGDVNVILSYGSHDSWLEYALQSDATWSSVVDALEQDSNTAVTIALTSGNDATLTDDDTNNSWTNIVVGRWIRLGNFVTSSGVNNQIVKVIAKGSNNEITIRGRGLVAETVAASAATSNAKVQMGGHVENGVLCQSIVIERENTDLVAASKFAVFNGMVLDGFNFTITPGSLIEGAFTFLGKSQTTGTATIGDGSNAAAPGNRIMNAVDDVSAIMEGTGLDTVTDATEFTITYANNLAGRDAIGNLGPTSIRSGTIDINGTLNVYLVNRDLMDKYLDFDDSAVAVVFVDNVGNGYVWELPHINYTDGDDSNPGQNNDIEARMTYEASKDTTDDRTMIISRFAGPF